MKQTQIQTSFSLTGIDLATKNVSLKFFTGSNEPIAVSVKTQLLSERINEGNNYYVNFTSFFVQRKFNN